MTTLATLDKHDDDCDCKKPSKTVVRFLTTVKCLACEHAWPISVQAHELYNPLSFGVFRCTECGARMAHGQLLLREVIEPYVDDRGVKWARRRFQDPKTKQDLFVVDTDRETALTAAKELLSLVTT